MAWNKALMFVKASKEEIDHVIPDVLTKTNENLFFDDAISGSMERAMGVSFYGDWMILSDVQGRVIFNDSYPKDISKRYSVKTFWISEGMIFREYQSGKLIKEVKGIEAGGKYLLDNAIQPIDEWGETRIIQILELEIFGQENDTKGLDILFDLKFDKYDLD
ncbi:MAG TPA: hypothetical protein VF008_13980 [Niastella sp.]